MAKVSPTLVGGALLVAGLAYYLARPKPGAASVVGSGTGTTGTGADPAATSALAAIYGNAITGLASVEAAQANSAAQIANANAVRDASLAQSQAQTNVAGAAAGASKVASITNIIPGAISAVGKLFGL